MKKRTQKEIKDGMECQTSRSLDSADVKMMDMVNGIEREDQHQLRWVKQDETQCQQYDGGKVREGRLRGEAERERQQEQRCTMTNMRWQQHWFFLPALVSDRR